MQKLSVVIITYNEEQNLKECLDSVSWADEIIIVDSGSGDRTLEIAASFTKKTILTDEVRYGAKRNFGIEAASNDWILWLDADERVTPELKEEMLRSVSKHAGDVTGFMVKRSTFFINKFMKHCGWYPDYNMRLFRKSEGVKFNSARVHEKLIYSGKTVKLRAPILHYTDRTFEHYMEKMNYYTSLSVMDLMEQHKSAKLSDIIFRPVLTFIKMYFLRLGFMDGFTGLILCTLSGISVFTKYSKLYFMASGIEK